MGKNGLLCQILCLPSWEIPNHLKDLLGDAREQLGTLNGIGRTLSNPSLLSIPLRQREALRSSSLEGTYATPMELLKYELDPKEPKSEKDQRNAWLEVANYNRAMQHGVNSLGKLPLSQRLIREMHGELLRGIRGRDKGQGEIRNKQVFIGSDYRYIPPPVMHLPKCLDDFEKYLHNHGEKINPLVLVIPSSIINSRQYTPS